MINEVVQNLPHAPFLTKPGRISPLQSVHVELSPPQTPQKSVSFLLFSIPSQPNFKGSKTII